MIVKAKFNVQKNLRIDLKYLNEINFAYFVDLTKKSPCKMFKKFPKNPRC